MTELKDWPYFCWADAECCPFAEPHADSPYCSELLFARARLLSAREQSKTIELWAVDSWLYCRSASRQSPPFIFSLGDIWAHDNGAASNMLSFSQYPPMSNIVPNSRMRTNSAWVPHLPLYQLLLALSKAV